MTKLSSELKEESTSIARPSREVSQCDGKVPGTEDTGPENAELKWAQKHVPEDPVQEPEPEPAPQPVLGVFRKTELHTTPPDTGSEDLKKLMRQMMQRLKSRDPEILYLQYETAFRDFICSLMVRQYRAEKEQREQVEALWEQLDFLDERLERSTDRLERLIHELTTKGRP